MSLLTLALLSCALTACVGVIGFCVGMALGLRRVRQVNDEWYWLLANERQHVETLLPHHREHPSAPNAGWAIPPPSRSRPLPRTRPRTRSGPLYGDGTGGAPRQARQSWNRTEE